MVQDDLSKFMTIDTIRITFEYLEKLKKENIKEVKSKSAPEIGYIVYNCGLNCLLRRIVKEKINGKKFIQMYCNPKKKDFIKDTTGWNIDEIYQTNAALFAYNTFTLIEFCQNVYSIRTRIRMKNMTKKQRIDVVHRICSKHDNLTEHKNSFISWFQQNDIDGSTFNQQTFVKAIVKYNNNNSRLTEPSTKFFTALHRYCNEEMSNDMLPMQVINSITSTTQKFDVEKLHFQIKHGKDSKEFSDAIVNMVNDLVQNNEEKCEDDFVKQIYEMVADCFILNKLTGNDMSLDRQQDWTCYNCNNYNFHYYIGVRLM
eukprot:132375_1